MLGQLRMNHGQVERAIADAGEAIRIEPTDVGFALRAAAYHKLGQHDRALPDADEAIRLKPSAASFLLRSILLHKLKRTDAAIRDCDEALSLEPRKADLHELRASLASEVTDYDRAVREYDEALRLDSGRAASLYHRGLIGLALDRPSDADGFRAHLNRKGWGGENAVCLALVGTLAERRAGRPAEARALLDEAVRRCDTTWPAPILRHLRGEITEAELLKAADNPDRLQNVSFFLGLDRLVSGDRDGATARLRQAGKGPDDSTYTALARAALVRLEAIPGRPLK